MLNTDRLPNAFPSIILATLINRNTQPNETKRNKLNNGNLNKNNDSFKLNFKIKKKHLFCLNSYSQHTTAHLITYIHSLTWTYLLLIFIFYSCLSPTTCQDAFVIAYKRVWNARRHCRHHHSIDIIRWNVCVFCI